MRIKFKKGFTPEDVASIFLDIVKKRDMVIGSVNIYIQEYDENMKPLKFEDEYIVVEPCGISEEIYAEYVACQRRKKMKVV